MFALNLYPAAYDLPELNRQIIQGKNARKCIYMAKIKIHSRDASTSAMKLLQCSFLAVLSQENVEQKRKLLSCWMRAKLHLELIMFTYD